MSYPSHGVLTIDAFGPGSFKYALDTGFVGTDTFTYKVRDERNGESNVATVTITITEPPVNNAPTAVSDLYTAYVDTPPIVAAPGVLANDTDIDGVNPQVSDSASVTISNVAPAVTLGQDVEIDEGDAFSDHGAFTDPGAKDTHTATVDYGDGSGDQALALNPDGSFDLNHDYLADDGQYDVEVCVTDDDEGSGCDALQVTVLNVVPTITDITSGVSRAGATITVAASDPAGPNDPLRYAFDCDNNGGYEVGPQPETSATCAFGHHEGTFQITVQVDDGDGGVTTGSVSVTITTHLCANDYTGVLRYAADCHSHETALTIPGDGPVTVCASTYNGLLRLPANDLCARHEINYALPDDGPLNVCVNNLTQTLRVIDDLSQCTRHEFGRAIAATKIGETGRPRSR